MEKNHAHVDLLARKHFDAANSINPTIFILSGWHNWGRHNSHNLTTILSPAGVQSTARMELSTTMHVSLPSVFSFSHPGR